MEIDGCHETFNRAFARCASHRCFQPWIVPKHRLVRQIRQKYGHWRRKAAWLYHSASPAGYGVGVLPRALRGARIKSVAVLGLLFVDCGCQRGQTDEAPTSVGPNRSAEPGSVTRGAVGLENPRPQGPSSPNSESFAQDLEPGDRALVASDAHRLRTSVVARVETMLSPGIDGSDGWVLAHAVLGFGPDFRIGARPAWRVLVNRYGAVDELSGRLVFGDAPPGVAIEPHLGLVAKTLASAGVNSSSIVRTAAGVEAPVGRVALPASEWPTSRELRVDSPGFLPGVPGRLDDVAWVLEASALWGGSEEASRRLILAQDALEALHELYAPVRGARDSKGHLRKDGRGLFALTCGGAHLLQAIFAAHGAPGGERLPRKKLLDLRSLSRWRYEQELAAIDELLVVPAADRRALLGQRLKLTGHYLETLRAAESSGLVDDEADHVRQLSRVESEVVATLAVLEERGAFGGLTAATERWSQADRDLVGDALHGVRGLRLGL